MATRIMITPQIQKKLLSPVDALDILVLIDVLLFGLMVLKLPPS